MNVSPPSLMLNNKISFCHNLTSTITNSSSIGSLNHQTSMFRELETDEFVQNHILYNLSSNPKITLVSAGCSSGEEIMSYLIMLDDVWDKLNLSAFDLDIECVKQAKTGKVYILSDGSEKLLFKKAVLGGSYKAKIFNKFHKYFKPTGKTRLPEDNNYLRYLKITNPAKYKKEVSSMTSAEFKLNPELIKKIRFFKGDIKTLQYLYLPNSVDVLLLRNAMYHLLCVQNEDDERTEREDSKAIANNIARQLNKVLKTGGMVVFGEQEYRQGYSVDTIRKAMSENGFVPVHPSLDEKNRSKNKNIHIWKKIENV